MMLRDPTFQENRLRELREGGIRLSIFPYLTCATGFLTVAFTMRGDSGLGIGLLGCAFLASGIGWIELIRLSREATSLCQRWSDLGYDEIGGHFVERRDGRTDLLREEGVIGSVPER